jgi:hypothetical protein
MLFNPESANAGANGGLYLKSIETAATQNRLYVGADGRIYAFSF